MKPVALSPSSIDSYNQCQWKFFLAKHLNIRSPTTAALAKGSFFHAGIEECATHKLETGEFRSPDQFAQKAFDILKDDEKKALSQPEREMVELWLKLYTKNIEKYIHGGYTLLDIETRFYMVFERVGDKFYRIDNILGPEYYYNLPPEDLLIINGRMDLVLSDKNDTMRKIVDFKTSQKKNAKTSDELYYEVQPRVYHLAATELWPGKEISVVFDYIHAFQSPISFSEHDKQEILEELHAVWQQIILNDNPRRPYKEQWFCRFCLGYQSNECLGTWNKFKQGLIEV